MTSRLSMLLLRRRSRILLAFLLLNLLSELLRWASLWGIILILVMDGIGLILLSLLRVCLIKYLVWLEFQGLELLDFLDLWEVWRVCLVWNYLLKLCLVPSFSLEEFLDLLASFLLYLRYWAFLYGLVQYILDVILKNGLMMMELGILFRVMIGCVSLMINVVLEIFVIIDMML